MLQKRFALHTHLFCLHFNMNLMYLLHKKQICCLSGAIMYDDLCRLVLFDLENVCWV